MSNMISVALRNILHLGDWNSGLELEEKGIKMTETVPKIMMESDRMHGLYGPCGSRYLK